MYVLRISTYFYTQAPSSFICVSVWMIFYVVKLLRGKVVVGVRAEEWMGGGETSLNCLAYKRWQLNSLSTALKECSYTFTELSDLSCVCLRVLLVHRAIRCETGHMAKWGGNAACVF